MALIAALSAIAIPTTATPAYAAPTISGTVVDSGDIQQPDVVVTVLNAGASNVVTTTTTNGVGFFSVTVPSGGYDLRFTPPETSGLRSYLATGINADQTSPLTIILKPIMVIRLEGVVRNTSGGLYAGAPLSFHASGGPETRVTTDNVGRYSVELLAGQYSVSMPYHNNFLTGGYIYSSFNFTPSSYREFDQSQTLDLVASTSLLTVSVRDVNGNAVTDAGVRYGSASVSNATFTGFSYVPSGAIRVDGQGNLALPILTGATPSNAAVVLASGLTIPFTIPTMNTDRRLYLIFDRVTGGLFVDEIGPTVTPHPDRAPNAHGWYKDGVTIGWESRDPLPSSGAATIPAPTFVDTEGAGQLITSEPSCDPAGNCTVGEVRISLDRTKPQIAYELSEPANPHGWHSNDVTVSFTCSDALSGIESCPGPVTVNAEQANQAITGTAVDNAGNSEAVTAVVSLDRTAPNIVPAVSQASNAGGWNNGDVTVSFECDDDLSGMDSCSAPVTLTEDGPNQLVVGTAVDRAGNTAIVSLSISIDKSKPLITAVRTDANGYGWNNGDVTVSFACSDAQSGIASCSQPVVLTQEGAGQSVTGTAVNNAGVSMSTTVSDISIDKTAPLITYTIIGDPNAAGWYKSAPRIHFTCSDSLSGIAVCPDDIVLTGDGADQVAAGTAVDRAGNIASAATSGIDVDLSIPNVTVVGILGGAHYPLDLAPLVSCATTDTTSGVAIVAALTVGRDETGMHTATCTGATDVAGNPAPPRSVSYYIEPTASSLTALTGEYVSGQGEQQVEDQLRRKLEHGLICQYIAAVNRESTVGQTTLTPAQAVELIYWARILDPSC